MKNSSAGGALLFALITAFVLSLVSTTFILFTSNQYHMINSGIERTRAFYRAQAGMEYAIYQAYTDSAWLDGEPTYTVPIDGDNIVITVSAPDANGIYTFSITAHYQT